jgi:hypothetical protein
MENGHILTEQHSGDVNTSIMLGDKREKRENTKKVGCQRVCELTYT